MLLAIVLPPIQTSEVYNAPRLRKDTLTIGHCVLKYDSMVTSLRRQGLEPTQPCMHAMAATKPWAIT